MLLLYVSSGTAGIAGMPGQCQGRARRVLRKVGLCQAAKLALVHSRLWPYLLIVIFPLPSHLVFVNVTVIGWRNKR